MTVGGAKKNSLQIKNWSTTSEKNIFIGGNVYERENELLKTFMEALNSGENMRKWKPPSIPKRCDAVKRALKELHESKKHAASGWNKKVDSTQQKDLEYLLEESARGETF